MNIQRIAYVLHIFPKLSETFVAGELAELRQRGIELRILSLLPPREAMQHEIIGRAGLADITTYNVTRFPAVLRAFKPQLLHAHFATEATAKARELSADSGLPFTFTAHGYDIHRKPPADFRERTMAARAVVTVSDANANYIAKAFDIPAEHLRVIPCGVDTERFCPSQEVEGSSLAAVKLAATRGNGEPTRFRRDDEPLWIVCVARHVKVKNLGLLLEACGLLHGRGVKFRCAMIGNGPEHECLKTKRARLGLESVVEMPGALEQGEVLKWWQRAAVGVLSSENEGMPVSLMEAAACAVPVVAPAVGGIPELVRDGETGLLAKPNDLRGFVAALERLLGDGGLRSQLGLAARRRAEERFSVKHQVDQLLALWSEVVPAQVGAGGGAVPSAPNPGVSRHVPVEDPFNAAADAGLPTVAEAVDAECAAAQLKRHLPRLSGTEGVLKLKAIRVIRHKPGRRCVIEYDVRQKVGRVKGDKVTIIGKIRARRSGNEGFRQLEMIWNAGFDAQSNDGISVPEPLGVISTFKMWCQREVPGEVSTRLLSGPEGVGLARRIAEAIHKLHRANLPTERVHSMTEELKILRECFDKTAALRPEWQGRLARLMTACEKLGASVPTPNPCGIHRDCYSSQVIVGEDRLWLIDFDLFCLGDPGLDVGNFLGHIIEQSLRERGDAVAFCDVERAMEERFVELSGERVRPAVRAYTTLTLARHVYLSTQFPDRQHTTEKLMELCERRLA